MNFTSIHSVRSRRNDDGRTNARTSSQKHIICSLKIFFGINTMKAALERANCCVSTTSSTISEFIFAKKHHNFFKTQFIYEGKKYRWIIRRVITWNCNINMHFYIGQCLLMACICALQFYPISVSNNIWETAIWKRGLFKFFRLSINMIKNYGYAQL